MNNVFSVYQSPNKVYFSDFVPGCLSKICALQSDYYARHWEFGAIYESVMAAGVSEFLLRFDKHKDFVQVLIENNQVVGGITVDHHQGHIGQLRWFFVAEHLHGTGIGKKLMSNAMAFVNRQKIRQVYLTTFEGLDKAQQLYLKHGFKITKQTIATSWGKEVKEQRYEWHQK